MTDSWMYDCQTFGNLLHIIDFNKSSLRRVNIIKYFVDISNKF